MRPLSRKADVSRLLSAQEQKTRHQFVTKNRLFSGCFEVCGLRKSKTSKGFLIVDLKIDTVEVRRFESPRAYHFFHTDREDR
jgi:hypothetical protein